MKKTLTIAALALSLPVCAQDAAELRKLLRQKEAEVQQLKQRIERLERELTPRRVAATDEGAMADGPEPDSERALERALVRERSLLLSAGRFEIEPNFAYSRLDLDGGNFKRDAYGPGLALRIGLPWRLQLDAGVPYVWERRETAGVTNRADGVGDPYLALSKQLLLEQGARPSVIGTLGYQFASGRNTLFSGGTPVALGSGFDAVSAGLTLLKRSDPLVFFGNYTFTHSLAGTQAGTDVDLGNVHGLRFGTALATSPATSLRAALSMRFFDKTRVNGVALPGTDDPVGVLELGGSAVVNASTAIDVLVGIGVTRSAPDLRIGVAVPIRF